MKKMDFIKTIQLGLFMVISFISMSKVLLNPSVSQKIAGDSDIRLLAIMLWAALGLSFLFIFVDFTLYAKQRKNLATLALAVKSDPLSKMANRFSVDSNITKYSENGLPEKFSCIMFSISNIQKINENYGREEGNHVIQDFSMILSLSSRKLCFVGKNGGNRYLALFDDGDRDKMRRFLERISAKIQEYNSDPANHVIRYAYGIADRADDAVNSIQELIALADKRIVDGDSGEDTQQETIQEG
jgi:diguanylate cyclase (GGDEF)-like protein